MSRNYINPKDSLKVMPLELEVGSTIELVNSVSIKDVGCHMFRCPKYEDSHRTHPCTLCLASIGNYFEMRRYFIEDSNFEDWKTKCFNFNTEKND